MIESEPDIFGRISLLLGSDTLQEIGRRRVIIFGVGGVGSWCAEGLVRSGITHLTIVDSDCVAPTNVNRQLMATTRTIGQVKVDALRQRLLDINPSADITAIREVYTADTAESFHIGSYDYIVDAIDSLKDKALLIFSATKTDAVLFSSMGAALKMDPTKIRVAEFWKVRGCPLGAALRRRFKHSKEFPGKKFRCIYSEELLQNRGLTDESCSYKAQINGSMVHITAIYGLMISGLILEDICDKTNAQGQKTE